MTDTNEKKGALHARAIDLYTPPFRFEFGYIWDAKGQMVADNHVPDESEGAALRVRGWGRISYMDDPEALQDEVGNIIATAMTEHWQRQNSGFTNEPVADVVAWHKEGEERTCDIRWRRHDVAPGPLYAVPPLVPRLFIDGDIDAETLDKLLHELKAGPSGNIIPVQAPAPETPAYPQPPELSIVWYDTPEETYSKMWESAAEEEGISVDELVSGSCFVGVDDQGEDVDVSMDDAFDGMRALGCWGWVDTYANKIHAWSAPDTDPEQIMHFLAHEIGHVTGTADADDFQEEMRAEQYGFVARMAFKMMNDRVTASQPSKN